MIRKTLERAAALALTLAAISIVPALAGEPLHSLDEAKALAARNGQPILVDFYAVWCGPCKAFTKASEAEGNLKSVLENVVLVKIDAEKDKGVDLAKEQKVVGFPTFVLMTAEGKTIDRWIGFSGGDEFAGSLKVSLEDPTPLTEKESRFAANPTEKGAAGLARVRDSRGEYAEAVNLYRKAADLSGRQGAYAMEIFWAQSSGQREGTVSAEDVAAAGTVAIESGATVGDIMAVSSVMTSVARRAEKADMAAPFLTAAVKASEGATDEEMVHNRRMVLIDHALIVEKNPEKALQFKRESMPEGWQTKPPSLNDFAWWCFENRLNLDEALEMARKGAELAEPGPDRAMILDTAAEICLARGGCEDAVELAAQAVKEDPNREYFKKQLARFQKELAAKTGK